MLKALVFGGLLLGNFTCVYTNTKSDGDRKETIVIVSNPQATDPQGPLPAYLDDLDGDGALDVVTPERWFLWVDGAWRERPAARPFEPPAGEALLVALLEDLDGDGEIDRILLDGVPVPAG